MDLGGCVCVGSGSEYGDGVSIVAGSGCAVLVDREGREVSGAIRDKGVRFWTIEGGWYLV